MVQKSVIQKIKVKMHLNQNDNTDAESKTASIPTAADERDAPTSPMHLTARPKGAASLRAIESLSGSIIELKGKRKSPSAQYIQAVGAMIADLLRAASCKPVRPCFRELAAKAFTGMEVGYQPFTRALADMERHGYVAVTKGTCAWKDQPGTVTRIYSTPRLLQFLLGFGVTPQSRFAHFAYKRAYEDTPPIQLRASSIRKKKTVTRGRNMKVDYDHPTVKYYAAQIRKINRFLADQTIIGPDNADLDDVALYRVFNCGDQPNYEYNKGGRIYGKHQNIERDKRHSIRINRHDTIEIDVSACFLTIAHHLLGKSFPNSPDPYEGPDLPRPIIKAWINMTLSYGNYHSRWPKETVDDLAEQGFNNVRKRHAISKIRKDILKHFPIIEEWCNSPFDWSDLFFIESQIMTDLLECLAFEHGIAALPIHDAVIIPKQYESVAKAGFSDMFYKHTKIRPIIK